jgi:hypothetical protein
MNIQKIATSPIILALLFVLTACSASSIKYTESEMRVIPHALFPKAFRPGELFMVKTKKSKQKIRVTGYEGKDYLVGLDENNNILKITLSDIKEIEKVREKVPKESKSSTSATDLGEFAIYAPLIPVGVAWPVLGGPLGLDEGANSIARQKALLIYGDMTREELRVHVGEPQQRYQCEDGTEVWAYSAEQVLYGGKFIFISNWNQKVYFTSYRFLKNESCTPITD